MVILGAQGSVPPPPSKHTHPPSVSHLAQHNTLEWNKSQGHLPFAAYEGVRDLYGSDAAQLIVNTDNAILLGVWGREGREGLYTVPVTDIVACAFAFLKCTILRPHRQAAEAVPTAGGERGRADRQTGAFFI